MSKLHYNKSKFENEIDLIDKIISIYSILKFEKDNLIKPFEKNVLIYYIRKGVNEESLASVCEDRNINKNYLHRINKSLRDKGYLVHFKNNFRRFDLNPELEVLRKSFIEDKLRNYLISFERK